MDISFGWQLAMELVSIFASNSSFARTVSIYIRQFIIHHISY